MNQAGRVIAAVLPIVVAAALLLPDATAAQPTLKPAVNARRFPCIFSLDVILRRQNDVPSATARCFPRSKATGQLAKTDRLDADLLALFAERVRPTPRPLPEPVLQQLDALLRERPQSVGPASLGNVT